MRKRLLLWGNISLGICVTCLTVFCYRNDQQDVGFDTLNTWLFVGIIGGIMGAMILKSIARFKKINEEEKQEAAAKE